MRKLIFLILLFPILVGAQVSIDLSHPTTFGPITVDGDVTISDSQIKYSIHIVKG